MSAGMSCLLVLAWVVSVAQAVVTLHGMLKAHHHLRAYGLTETEARDAMLWVSVLSWASVGGATTLAVLALLAGGVGP